MPRKRRNHLRRDNIVPGASAAAGIVHEDHGPYPYRIRWATYVKLLHRVLASVLKFAISGSREGLVVKLRAEYDTVITNIVDNNEYLSNYGIIYR